MIGRRAAPSSGGGDGLRPAEFRALRTAFVDRILRSFERDRVRWCGRWCDDRFIWMWEYYPALCEAGFATRATQDLQIVCRKRRAIA